jgi:hypothetical protein
MWCDEIERLGFIRCTPIGYTIRLCGDYARIFSLVTLVGMPIQLLLEGIRGTFKWPFLWLLTVPFGLYIVSSSMVSFSLFLASRKHFKYDYSLRESSWIEDGKKQTYTVRDWEASNGKPQKPSQSQVGPSPPEDFPHGPTTEVG